MSSPYLSSSSSSSSSSSFPVVGSEWSFPTSSSVPASISDAMALQMSLDYQLSQHLQYGETVAQAFVGEKPSSSSSSCSSSSSTAKHRNFLAGLSSNYSSHNYDAMYAIDGNNDHLEGDTFTDETDQYNYPSLHHQYSHSSSSSSFSGMELSQFSRTPSFIDDSSSPYPLPESSLSSSSSLPDSFSPSSCLLPLSRSSSELGSFSPSYSLVQTEQSGLSPQSTIVFQSSPLRFEPEGGDGDEEREGDLESFAFPQVKSEANTEGEQLHATSGVTEEEFQVKEEEDRVKNEDENEEEFHCHEESVETPKRDSDPDPTLLRQISSSSSSSSPSSSSSSDSDTDSDEDNTDSSSTPPPAVVKVEFSVGQSSSSSLPSGPRRGRPRRSPSRFASFETFSSGSAASTIEVRETGRVFIKSEKTKRGLAHLFPKKQRAKRRKTETDVMQEEDCVARESQSVEQQTQEGDVLKITEVASSSLSSEASANSSASSSCSSLAPDACPHLFQYVCPVTKKKHDIYCPVVPRGFTGLYSGAFICAKDIYSVLLADSCVDNAIERRVNPLRKIQPTFMQKIHVPRLAKPKPIKKLTKKQQTQDSSLLLPSSDSTSSSVVLNGFQYSRKGQVKTCVSVSGLNYLLTNCPYMKGQGEEGKKIVQHFHAYLHKYIIPFMEQQNKNQTS